MKKLFISLLGLVVLIVGALLALVLLVNPNQFNLNRRASQKQLA